MKSISKLKESIPPNYLLVLALILTSIAISIRGSDGEVNLLLGNHPVMIFLMILFSSLLVGLYFHLSSQNISRLSDEIKALSQTHDTDYSRRIKELTSRQKEVYNLIVDGKTNKEMMAELFIEKSTLKSHINQIYKKLDIKNRRQLKSTK